MCWVWGHVDWGETACGRGSYVSFYVNDMFARFACPVDQRKMGKDFFLTCCWLLVDSRSNFPTYWWWLFLSASTQNVWDSRLWMKQGCSHRGSWDKGRFDPHSEWAHALPSPFAFRWNLTLKIPWVFCCGPVFVCIPPLKYTRRQLFRDAKRVRDVTFPPGSFRKVYTVSFFLLGRRLTGRWSSKLKHVICLLKSGTVTSAAFVLWLSEVSSVCWQYCLQVIDAWCKCA